MREFGAVKEIFHASVREDIEELKVIENGMEVEITLKNYRCFPDTNPARFILQKGHTGFIGVNNSGKSSLLKFLYEFRKIFQDLGSPERLTEALQKPQELGLARSIFDPEEIFCNTNNRDLEVQLKFTPTKQAVEGQALVPEKLVLKISRSHKNWRAEISTTTGPVTQVDSINCVGTTLRLGGQPTVDLSDFFTTCKDLANTLYIGPFRNVLSFQSNENYLYPSGESV